MSTKERQRMIYRLIRGDAEDEDEPKKKKGGGHGNNRLPYGLCEEFGIDLPAGATPQQAWEALKGEGITPDEAYSSLKKYKNISNYKHKVRREHYRGTKPTTNSQHSSTHYRPKNATVDTPLTEKELAHKGSLIKDATAEMRILNAYNGGKKALKEAEEKISKNVLDFPRWGFSLNIANAQMTLDDLIKREPDELDKKRLEKMNAELWDMQTDECFFEGGYEDMAHTFTKLAKRKVAKNDLAEIHDQLVAFKKNVDTYERKDYESFKSRHPEIMKKLEGLVDMTQKVKDATKDGVEATQKAIDEFGAALRGEKPIDEKPVGERAIAKVEDVKSKSGIDAKYPEVTKTLTDVDNTFRELKKDPNAHSYGDTAYLMQNVHTTLKRALSDTTRARLKTQDEEEKKQLAAREKDITEKMATADVTGMYYKQKHMQDRLDSLKKKGVSSSVLEDEKGEYESFLNKSLNKIDTTYKRGQMNEEGRKFMREKVRPALIKALWGEEDKL